MEEKNQEILDTADALREDIRRREKEQRNTFYKGMTVGILMMLMAGLLVFFVFPFVRIQYGQGKMQQAAQQTEQASVLTPNVRNKIDYLVKSIDAYYYEDVDDEGLVNGLYKGLLEGIGDRYSAYYTPEEYESMMISATSSLSGIGAVLQQDPDTMQVTVNHVYEGSPAEKAGIRNGDMIVEVDDIASNSMELTKLVTFIRGDKGTVVHLKIYREGQSKYLEMDVTRDIVDVPTVASEMLKDHIGYITIAEFGSNTGQEFADQVKELEAKGMKAMIVDLRDNPGGMVESVVEILDQILPEGVTVWTEDKYGSKKEYHSDASCMSYPLAVLVNENSASSSEIFAGAIRDFKYGTLIGTKTYGKGIVQGIRKLSDGSAIKLTTGKYFTPGGENIHDEGIEPDIKLEYEYLDPDAEKYDMMHDNQILKAIEVLNNRKK